MSKNIRKQDALDYHKYPQAGKIEVVPTKSTVSQRDLALAYSPGVAEPCLEIAANPETVYDYTSKGNLVAVISNGTAVLGLGDIGPEASKPVMEGKGVLFKKFAGIDVFDIELNCTDVESFIATVKALEPTFGGVNLEDIKAPDCFEIETRLKQEMKIPVMHDDQHGTAIISGAALINALDLIGKKIENIRVVFNGAGASAISCAKLFLAIGVQKSNLLMLDSKGVIHTERPDLDPSKTFFASQTALRTLDEAFVNADVFVGLSKGNVVNANMLRSMAANPIVFALANPDPEIGYDEAKSAREDLIFATGRSDYPNQVNNVLGFPYIFRGALDVRATEINEAMKIAAVYALAQLTKEPVPEVVNLAYNIGNLSYGPEYIIPKPMDPRLITRVSIAVAKAAIESGVAKKPITDWDQYAIDLNKRIGSDDRIMRAVMSRAKANPKRVVFAEADNYKVLKAVQIVLDEGIAIPILLGPVDKIRAIIAENHLEISENIVIIDPRSEDSEQARIEYGDAFFHKRNRRGINNYEAKKMMRERNYFGCMMVELGHADAFISGLTRNYPDTIRPGLQIIGTDPSVKLVAGMYILQTKNGPLFFADTTVNRNPTSEDLANIAALTAHSVQQMNIEPRIAFLSYSNFGSVEHEDTILVRKAVEIFKEMHPEIIADGEIQANLAFDTELLRENYPFTTLAENGPNILIFPNLAAGNIAYKLLMEIGGADALGPILLGIRKPVHILQLGSTVREIVNMVGIAVVDAQDIEKK